MNTPGFEPVTQWSEVECSTARPSAPRYVQMDKGYLYRFTKVHRVLKYKIAYMVYGRVQLDK